MAQFLHFSDDRHSANELVLLKMQLAKTQNIADETISSESGRNERHQTYECQRDAARSSMQGVWLKQPGDYTVNVPRLQIHVAHDMRSGSVCTKAQRRDMAMRCM